MARLTWDSEEQKIFQVGLDRGVLYTDTIAVAWNGLTSAVMNSEQSEATSLYFNGVKTFDLVTVADFSGKISAVTYPDEFLPYDGHATYYNGVYLGNQVPGTFGLSYRTLIGNSSQGTDYAYKIHILYNLTATPDSKTAQTMADSSGYAEFSWNVTSCPEQVPGFRPTSHFSIESTKVLPAKLSAVENALYGTVSNAPYLPTVTQLLALLA